MTQMRFHHLFLLAAVALGGCAETASTPALTPAQQTRIDAAMHGVTDFCMPVFERAAGLQAVEKNPEDVGFSLNKDVPQPRIAFAAQGFDKGGLYSANGTDNDVLMVIGEPSNCRVSLFALDADLLWSRLDETLNSNPLYTLDQEPVRAATDEIVIRRYSRPGAASSKANVVVDMIRPRDASAPSKTGATMAVSIALTPKE